MKLSGLLILAVFASEKKVTNYEEEIRYNKENLILVKIEESEDAKVSKKSAYIGVSFNKNKSKWRSQRQSKNEKKTVYNGYYDDEETAAHASDTLARKLMDNGEQGHKLNFPDDDTEVYREEKIFSSTFIGVFYDKRASTWRAQRQSKNEKKNVYNGTYNNKETAAHASDTLARKFIANGEQGHKLNFPDNYIEVYPEEKKFSSKFIGVFYDKNASKWKAQRWSKNEDKLVHYGSYKDEETAAHASDTLARKLMKNGEQGHKLNFPDDDAEVYPVKKQNKRKRQKGMRLDQMSVSSN